MSSSRSSGSSSRNKPMMGKKDGLCAGRGGSQHICDNGFFSNGVQGGIMPLAAGLALSEKYNNTNLDLQKCII